MEFWKNRAGVYVYRFQKGGKGSRKQRSTGEKNRDLAWKIASQALKDARVRLRGQEPVCTLDELAGKWLEGNPPPEKSAAYIRSMDTFRRLHLYHLASLPVDLITTQEVKKARTAYIQAGHNLFSANHWLRLLKVLFRYAWKELKMIEGMPWELRRLKPQDPVRQILPPSKTAAWFAAVDACGRPEVSLAVRLMWGVGLREAEALGARWEWLNLEEGTYTPGETKNRKAEPLPLRRALKEYLRPRAQAKGRMIAKADGSPWAPGLCRTVMRKANVACELEGITPHRLRSTYATLLMRLLPPKEVQELMRHGAITTTMLYTTKDKMAPMLVWATAALFVALATQQPPGPAVGGIVDDILPGAAGELKYRLYRPATLGPHPVVVYYHGGGWVLGGPNSTNPPSRDLSVRSNPVFVRADYRHAPEPRFPRALDAPSPPLGWFPSNAEPRGGRVDPGS